MNKEKMEYYFSAERLAPYFKKFPGNEGKALELYKANIAISEALYTPVSILEVALRNKIDRELSHKYQSRDWYAGWHLHPVLRFAWHDINQSINRLHDENKPITSDKIVASLMFGFWTSLFNERYERELWGHLRLIFPHIPKQIRQRQTISGPLNNIRKHLRNRIFHNEPIIFRLATLQKNHNNILLLLNWMSPELSTYVDQASRFSPTLDQVVAIVTDISGHLPQHNFSVPR